MRQGSTASLGTAFSGLLLVLVLGSQHSLFLVPVLAVGLPMRVVGGGSAELANVAVNVARIMLATSWVALLFFESRRYWVSWMFSQRFPKSGIKLTGDSKEES